MEKRHALSDPACETKIPLNAAIAFACAINMKGQDKPPLLHRM